jgi:FkbM family methyltransferase
MKLDLGAGPISPTGFTPLGRPHGSKIYPLPGIADNAVDEIRASHCLEHFSHREVPAVLKEWVRVLKPGGLLRIAVPDFAKIAKNYIEGVPQPTQTYIMGNQDDADDFHKSLFDRERLTGVMIAAGLVHIEPWTSELGDWAAESVSLNLSGRKPQASDLKPGSRQRPLIMIERALMLHQNGRSVEAAALYKQILDEDPGNADALHLLGVVEAQQKKYQSAIELFDRALAINSANVALYCNRAEALRQLKRFEDALTSYNLALAITPDSPEIFYKRGNTLQDLKRFEEAVVSYDRALALKPDYAEARTTRGNALRQLNRLDDTLPPIVPGTVNFHYLRDLVGTDAPVILDVGANDGETTAKFLATFPNCTVYAFEPDPRAIEKFKSRINNPRVHLFEIALGVTDGTAKFHASSGLPPGQTANSAERYKEGWDRSGSLRMPKSHKEVWPWVKFESTIDVTVQRLDSWAREHGITHIDFIWADVQGGEGDLIAGGPRTLAATRFLYLEYSDTEWYEGQPTLRQLVQMLDGFVAIRRFPMDILFKNTRRASSA